MSTVEIAHDSFWFLGICLVFTFFFKSRLRYSSALSSFGRVARNKLKPEIWLLHCPRFDPLAMMNEKIVSDNNLASRVVPGACGITNLAYAWLKFRQLSIG